MSAMDRLTTAFDARLSSLQQQLAQKLEPLLARYRSLAPREQLFVAVGVVAVAITLVYSLLWAPFALARSLQAEALAEQRALAQRLEVIAAAVQRVEGQGGARQGQGQSLLTLVDQAGRESQLGKAPSRLQPEGEREVKVWFEDVSFDAMTRWIASLESRYGIVVTNADVERRPTPGTVNARLTVSRP